MQFEIWPPWYWLVWSVSWVLKWPCFPLSPIVSGCLPLCGGWVLVGVAAFVGSEVVLFPVLSSYLPLYGGWGVVGAAASKIKIFRDQTHRIQSEFDYCWGLHCGNCQPPHHAIQYQPPPQHEKQQTCLFLVSVVFSLSLHPQYQ